MQTQMQISDKDLLALCRRYGKEAREWRNKFIGLLPEVNRRRLYEKEGFQSIYHFAAVLGGVSKDQVKRVLSLDRTFEDKPDLKEALVGGKVSVSKLAKVASIATKENQAELATLAEIHSREVLETMARDEKLCSREQNKQEEFFEETPKLNPSLSKEVILELNRLHEQKQDVNEILLDLLKQRNQRTEEKIQETHERLSGETHPPVKRYKNKETRDLLHEKYGKKCAHLGCNRPAEQIHHKVPFGLQSLHDPLYMVPLCREHHRIAHTIDLKFAEHLHNAQQTTPRNRDPYERFSTLD
ncbi:MAG: HNH endonuclease signature motif containing protein [Candidatus Gracilibacteria bacterium]|jgi:hypothetical protein